MIPIKTTTNQLIDWNVSAATIAYFKLMRKFLTELEVANTVLPHDPVYGPGASVRVKKVFERWNLYFIDVDEMPRINLDEPKGDLGAL